MSPSPPRPGRNLVHRHLDLLVHATYAFVITATANSFTVLLSCLPVIFSGPCSQTLHHYLGILCAASLGWMVFLELVQQEQGRRGWSRREMISKHQLTGAILMCFGSALMGDIVGKGLVEGIVAALSAIWSFLV